MSINVTVSGNPVSIKRGKMVTANPYDEKQEYDKRRLMRLEQVRQQSKEFAQDVRNKVRKEKTKQLGKIEKEGKEKLKSWQNRKLLDLQNQYREALDEIGMGHKAAEEIGDENEVLEQQKLQNEMTAQARGKVAEVKHQIEKNEANYKRAQPLQQRKLVRDIENTRAAMISSLEKHRKIKKCCKKKKKTKSTGINITIPESPSETTEASSESSKRFPFDKYTSESECWEDCSCSENSEADTEKSSSDTENNEPTYSGANGRPIPSEKSKEPPVRQPFVDQTSYRQSIENRKKLIDDFQSRYMEFPRDTRISDRIRQRELQSSKPDFCDFVTKGNTGSTTHYIPKSPKKTRDSLVSKEKLDPNIEDVCECIHYHSACPCKSKTANGPFKNISVQTDQYPSKDKCTCNHHQPECPKAFKKYTKDHLGQVESDQLKSQQSVGTTAMPSKTISVTNPPHTQVEIPSKPPVSVKGMGAQSQNVVNKNIQSTSSVKKTTTNLPESDKINYYNHQTRYQGTLPSTITVEKIGPESLETIPNAVSEAEWQEKIRQRDREAEIRGRKAMEKELIRRDYEEMMKKLPLLQRKEHIAGIGSDKPEYHMSEERLQQLEKKKQLKLENAFTKAFPDLEPAIVTLPRKQQGAPVNSNEPFEILDSGDPRITNRGTWDTDYNSPKMFTSQEVQEIIRSFTGQKQEDRYSKLKQLLKSLKMQKKQLIQELKALPRDDSVNALLNDLNSVSDSDEGRRSKHRLEEDNKPLNRKDRERKRKHASSEDPSSSSDSRTKKVGEFENNKNKQDMISRKSKKKRNKVLVLQNMSTQTTPKAGKDKPFASVSTKSLKEESNSLSLTKICNKIHSPCDCAAFKTYGSSEEVCQIVIKLQDNEDPKIEVLDKSAEKKESLASCNQKENKDLIENNLIKSKKRRSAEDNSSDTLKHEEIKTVGSPTSSKKKSINLSPKKINAKVGPDLEIFKKPLPKRPFEKSKLLSSGTDRNKSNSMRSNKESSRHESWQEQLSKNSMSTSSTSYFSPPDFLKPESFYNLRHKLQQQQVSAESFITTNVDPNIVKYIKKLINMSKASVDDLQVSSSDVQTPSQSVIEMESNNPLAQLHNIVKFINMKASEVAKELSYSTDDDISVPPNSTVNTTNNSQTSVNRSLKKSNQSLERSQLPERDSNESSRKSRESLLHQYSDVTDSCSKRIANLAGMIEKLRQEKLEILRDSNEKQESPKSIKDYSTTAYLDLPHSEKSVESNKSSTTTNLDEEELSRRLLEIDMNLAEKLKKFSQTREQEQQANEKKSQGNKESGSEQQMNIAGPSRFRQSDPVELSDEENRQFLERLRRLMEKSDEDHTKSRSKLSKSSEIPQLPSYPQETSRPLDLQRFESSAHKYTEPSKTPYLSNSKSKPAFVPLLLNMPQLPILEIVPDDYVLEENNGAHRHPPPSKGLAAIKRLNGNVSVMPHELSTIIEADSQLSTKISPNASRVSSSPNKEVFRPIDKTDISKGVMDGIPPLIVPEKSLTSHYKERSEKDMEDDKKSDRTESLQIAKERSESFQKDQIASQGKSSKSAYKNSQDVVKEKLSSSLEKSLDIVNISDQQKSTEYENLSEQKKKTRSDEQLNPASNKFNKSDKTKSYLSSQTSTNTDSTSSVSIVCADSTCSNLSRNASKTSLGTSSSDDMKSLEAMLKSIGMEWAIPTLHKTQEALALASSSSSPEVTSLKKTKSKSNKNKDFSPSCSEVSLKDFLMKQVMNKISSSSMKSEASPASFLQELSDISAIQALSGSEKMKQRTSTPLGSKGTSKLPKDSENVQLFTGASDISSVKASPKKLIKNHVQKKKDEDVFKSLSDSARSSSNLE